MRKRALSWLLAICMVVSLAPQVIPWAEAEENKDPFGITLKDDESFQASNLKDNPYGTDGWFPLITKSELVESKTKKDRGRNQYVYRYNAENATYRSENYSFGQDKGFSLIATAAFDADGDGRKELIANLAFSKDAKELWLYTTNENGEIGNSLKLETPDFLKKVEPYHATSHMAIAAGDFDGDGKESIVVYRPNALMLTEYEWKNNAWTWESSKDVSHIGNTLGSMGEQRLTWVMANDNDGGSDELRATPSVQLAVDDTDKDGKDELVVASSWNDLEQDNYKYDGKHNANWQCSWVSVFDKDTNTWNKTFNQVLEESGDNSEGGGETKQGRLRFAGVTVGNVQQTTGDVDAPEIICVGYPDKKGGDNCDINKDKFGVYTFRYSKERGYERIYTNEVDANGFTKGGCYSGDKIQDPVAVVAFASRGTAYADDLFIEGDVFRLIGQKYEFQDRDKYFNSDDDGIGRFVISNGGVSQAIAANFDGNIDGKEEVVFSTVQKYKHGSGHFWKTRMYRNTGSVNNDQWEDTWSHVEYGWSFYHDGETQVSLTAADIGENDGTQAKIKSKTREYTKPQVMAVLEAPPYFAEIAEGDIGNGTTAYGTSKTDGTGTSSNTTVSLGAMIGFEYEDPITNTGGGFEATISDEWTWETSESEEREVSITYSNDSGDNAVVVFRTPVELYEYEVRGYAAGATKDNRMVIGIQGEPATSMISVDDYNAAAAQFELDPITDDMIGSAGNPNSYHEGLPTSKTAEQSWSSGQTCSYAGIGTIEQSVTNTKSTEKSSSYAFNAEVSGFISVCGVKAGASVGGGFGEGTTVMNSSSTGKVGAVTARPDVENAENYDFNWQFATWTQHLNGDEVPVLGYLVTSITAPPSPAENLALSENTEHSMKLTWEAGDRPANEYRVYRYDPNNTYSPYTMLGTVSGGSVQDSTYSYVLEGLAPSTTYQYVVTGYSLANGESVYSETATGTTLAENGTTLKLNKLNDASALLGENAVFTADVLSYGSYHSTSFQWQEKLSGNNWKTMSGENKSTLQVEATTERMGAQYRCIVYGRTQAGDAVPYYTNAAKLNIGQNIQSGLTISGAASGNGAQATPYTGVANHTVVTEEKTEQTFDNVPATATIGETAAPVYKVGNTEQYVAVLQINNDTTYYAVTKSGNTYTAGNALTYTTNLQFKKGDAEYTTWPDTTAQGGVLQPLSVTIGNKTYYRYAAVKGTFGSYTLPKYNDDGELSNTPTAKDVEGKLTAVSEIGNQYISADGSTFYPYTSGMTSLPSAETISAGYTAMDLYQSGDTTLVGHLDKDLEYTAASGDTRASWDEIENYRLYEIAKTTPEGSSTATFTPAEITYSTTNTLSGTDFATVTNPTLEPEITNVTRSVISYTSESKTGRALTLSVDTKKADGSTAVNADYTIRLVNQTTGTVTSLSGKTNASGADSKTWTADAPGLYAIQVVTGENVTANQYYLATGAEDMYSLTASQNDAPVVSATYGDTLALKTSKITAAGAKSDYTGTALTYSYSVNGGAEQNITTPASFTLPEVGTYTLRVREGSKTLASTVLTVSKRAVTITPTWDKVTSGEAPNNLSSITAEAEGLASGDSLTDIVKIVCPLYKTDGNLDTTQSGAFTVSIDYVKGTNGQYTNAVQSFLSHYQVTLGTAQILRKLDTAPVSYKAGENGTVEGRYGDGGSVFTSGTSIEKGQKLRFQAAPKDGYVVDSWTVNGAKIDSSSTGYTLSENNTILTVNSFDSVMLDANKQMNVAVSFKSDKHTISYSVNSGEGTGTLTAKTADNNPVANGAAVAEGSDITFTAEPAAGYSVEKWTVDGEDYKWPDSEALYRSQTLTLSKVGASHNVTVYFTDKKTIAVTTSLIDEDGKASSAADITVTDATTSKVLDDLNTIESGSSLIFTAAPHSTNTGVKEWQTSTDGTNWETVTGSGGQKTCTLYNLTDTHLYVRAVLTTAQSYSLTFKVQQNNQDVTDESIAKLTAKINNRTLTSGDNQPAYSQADFALTLDDNYYVVSWSGVSNAVDNTTKSARLDSLTGNATVIVNIQEKPTVSWADPTGEGQINVKANGTNITSGTHVEPNSTVQVTATPTTDYVVLKINGENANPDWKENEITKEMTVGATGSYTAMAQFQEKPTVTWEEANGGSITVKDEKGNAIAKGAHVRPTSIVTVVAAPNNDYVAKTINGDEINTNKANGAKEATKQVSETSVNTVSASFLMKPVVTWSNAENGTISVSGTKDGSKTTISSGSYLDFGSTVEITAAPGDNYYVNKIQANGNELFTDSKANYTSNHAKTVTATEDLQANMTASAEFAQKPIITASGDANITVTAKQDGKTLNLPTHVEKYSGDIIFTAEPKTGYETDTWKVNNNIVTGAPVDAKDNDRTTYTQPGDITGDITASVTSKAIPQLDLTMAVTNIDEEGGHGTIQAKVTRKNLSGYNKTLTASGKFYRDSNLTLIATPAAGYRVQSWTIGGITEKTSEQTRTLSNQNQDVSVTVRFVKQGAGVTFGSSAGGTITEAKVGNTDVMKDAETGFKLEKDASIVLTAQPNEGYEMAGWLVGNTLDETTSETFTYTSDGSTDVHIEPKFRTIQYQIHAAATPDDKGTLSVIGLTDGKARGGETLTFTAVPGAGNKVVRWTINGTEQTEGVSGNVLTWNVPIGVPGGTIYDVLAIMTEDSFTLTYGQPANGSLTAVAGGKTIASGADDVLGGTKVTFTASPDAHYEVDSWTVDGQKQSVTGNTLDVTIIGNTTVSVTYKLKQYNVTLNQGEHGTVAANQSGSVTAKENVTFTATPDTGYHLSQWLVNGRAAAVTDNTLTLTITENTTVQPVFEIDALTVQYGLTTDSKQARIQATANGVALTSGSTVPYGSDVTLTVTTNGTDMVDSWSVNNAVVNRMTDTEDAVTTYELKNVTASQNIQVKVVAQPKYTITASAGSNGTVAIEGAEGNSIQVPRNGSVTLKATPADYYSLSSWTVNGTVQQSKSMELTLDGIKRDTNVIAAFGEAMSYEVTLKVDQTAVSSAQVSVGVQNATSGKTIQPGATKDTAAHVLGGSKLVFTAKDAADPKTMIGAWKINGAVQKELSRTMTIDGLTGNAEVEAIFVQEVLYSIPTDGTNYTVTVDERIPDDYGTAQQIRKNGTVTFTVKPTADHYFSTLKVNGTECLTTQGTDTATDKLTVVNNQNGSYTITVANVTKNIALEATSLQFRTEKKELTLPDELKNIYKDTDALKTELRTQVNKISSSISASNIQYYDIKLEYNDGSGWKPATKVHFPANGITVTIPYSDVKSGLDSSYTYTVIHMFTTDMKNHTIGDTEAITPIKGTDGISFKVDSLSPFAIGWYKASGGSGGGGGGAVSTVTLTFETNGGSSINKLTKESGTTVDLAAYKPTRAGYTFAGWFSDKALTKAVTSVKLTANTTVYAKWTQGGSTTQNPFVDVKSDAYYYDAVLWAVEQKITSGTSATTFSPEASCTRAQMVTFLWRAAGSPKVENGKNPFTDVKSDAYYYDAVLWAVEKGVTSGTSATTFSPDATVTRGQTVTFLYRNAGSPDVTGTMPFTDVEADAYYAKAVLWAVQQKITTGTSETTFSPASDCTRGQIVTFLYRAK